MISYGLVTINPYNGHQRREREWEQRAKVRSKSGDIIWVSNHNPYNGHQRRERERGRKRGRKHRPREKFCLLKCPGLHS